jgi:tetratricopeptide (TPR) repeat protein
MFLVCAALGLSCVVNAQTAPSEAAAQQAFNRGDWAAAANQYGKLAKASPQSSEYQAKLGLALGLNLGETGKCPEALPYLRKANTRGLNDDLTKTIGQVGLRCAMLLNQQDDAVDFLRHLRHEFPRDPDIQFLSVHVFSDLSIRASQDLLFTNPAAYQVHQLNAESLEVQGRWDDAMYEYRTVLEKNPKLPGIHYRIGRLILSKPKTATTFDDARKEFDAELSINPNNPGAEYVLGEMAREEEDWPDAIQHFGKAVRLDSNFADALIGYGRSLNAAGKADDAVAPLEQAVKLQPRNPTAHYHLAIALRRAGKKDDADREFAEYKRTSDGARQLTHDVQLGVLGPQQVDPQPPSQP